MIIYFCDRELNILGHASTELPQGIRVSQDKTVEDVESGVNSFECVLTWDNNTRSELEYGITAGNYILKQSDTEYDSLYQIVETESDTKAQEISLYAEDAGLDLLNTLCPAVTLTNKTIDQMLTQFLPAEWSVDIQDAPNTTKTYTWDGESTCTERVRSVVGLWDCELYYSFEIDGLQVKKRVLNVVQKRGMQTAIPQLRLNYDIDKIVTKTSIADLVTALNVTGGKPEGTDTPINLVGYNYSYTDYDTGDEYEVDTATGQMRNITAMDRWSSEIDPDGLWVGSYTFDTTDKAVLAGQARAELQRRCYPAVNYSVDFTNLPDGAKVGDRVNIIDDAGALYLEARLLQIETCEADHTKKATIGEYLLKTSGVAEQVVRLASDLAQQRATDKVIESQMQILTDTVGSLFTLEVDSDVILGVAHLTARLLNGNKDIKTDYDPNWFKWILRSEKGERLLGRGYTIDVDMNIIGYASTILCRFIRPQLYDLTDHNLEAITDQNLDPIQVSFAGIYNQPIVATRSLKSALKATRTTTEVGDPTVSREVNLYEKGGLYKSMADTVQYFWNEQRGEFAGAHITEKPQDEFKADPENGGSNLIIRSTNLGFRDGTRDMATFGADGQTFNNDYGEEVLLVGKTEYQTYGGQKLNWARYNNVAPFSMVVPWDITGTWTATYLNADRTTITGMALNPTQEDRTITWSVADCNTMLTNGVRYIYISYQAGGRFPYFTIGSDGVGDIGTYSYREGENCIASGNTSHAEGESTEASGINAHSQNYRTLASGSGSHASGVYTIAQGYAQTAIGRSNIAQGNSTTASSTDHAFIIGNGTTVRSNAMTVTFAGNTTIAGTLTQSSDRRLKEHINYLDADAVEFIDRLKPAHFIKDGAHHTGFYAQDVAEADKWHCMTGEMNGFMTLGYTELIAPLVAYVQKLEKRIAELEKGE